MLWIPPEKPEDVAVADTENAAAAGDADGEQHVRVVLPELLKPLTSHPAAPRHLDEVVLASFYLSPRHGLELP